MWPFTPKTAATTDARLIERLEKLERTIESIDVEWTEWYDKYRRLYARIAKRVERDADTDPPSRDVAPGATKPAAAVGNHVGHAPRLPRNLRGF